MGLGLDAEPTFKPGAWSIRTVRKLLKTLEFIFNPLALSRIEDASEMFNFWRSSVFLKN